jgi:hypothetical protein
MRVVFKGVYESHDRASGHQTVRIEHDHGFVIPAEPARPLGDVAGLTSFVVRSMSVKDLLIASIPFPQLEEPYLLFNPNFGIRSVAENEEIEMRRQPRARNRLKDGLDTCEQPTRLLIVCWHQQGTTGGDFRQRLSIRVDFQAPAVSGYVSEKTNDHGHEGESYPSKQ